MSEKERERREREKTGGGNKGREKGRERVHTRLLSASVTWLAICVAGIIDSLTPEMFSSYPNTFNSRILDFFLPVTHSKKSVEEDMMRSYFKYQDMNFFCHFFTVFLSQVSLELIRRRQDSVVGETGGYFLLIQEEPSSSFKFRVT